MIGRSRDGFETFVRASSNRLFRTAYLLMGSREEAEDLLQQALELTYRRWRRSHVIDAPEGYVRQAMVNLARNRWRRRRFRSVALTPEHDVSRADHTAPVEQRDRLRRALVLLGPGQRAVLVLRYWEDMSEADTARHLGCSTGTVKSQASRGLARLRELLEDGADNLDGPVRPHEGAKT